MVKQYKDRLRNRVFRAVGVLPLDDFDLYANDVFHVLETLDVFTKRTSNFAKVVAKKLNIDEEEKKDEKTDFREMYL